jgi:ABC-type nitrate/sulfonate/bicarbonate transport system ATPase subunit
VAKLEIQNATKQFLSPNGSQEPLTVLDNLSLTVEDGQFVCVLGPSGCGKTTLLRIVAGLIPLERGAILLDGVRVDAPHPAVSVVFQHIGLMPWKTVYENVALGLELQHHRRLNAEQKELVGHYLELVGLKGFESYFPYQISGGMQQRVGLARALVRKPKLLLMDEPFGALDAQTRAILQDELLRLWDESKATIFFITHDLDESIYLSDRVGVMTRRPGRIKELLDIPLARPRYSYDARATPEFGQLRHLAWESIKEELSRL